MKKALRAAEVEALLREIQRYLAYVDAFRTAEPRRPPADREGGKERS
jgi:hypothetical protein